MTPRLYTRATLSFSERSTRNVAVRIARRQIRDHDRESPRNPVNDLHSFIYVIV